MVERILSSVCRIFLFSAVVFLFLRIAGRLEYCNLSILWHRQKLTVNDFPGDYLCKKKIKKICDLKCVVSEKKSGLADWPAKFGVKLTLVSAALSNFQVV